MYRDGEQVVDAVAGVAFAVTKTRVSSDFTTATRLSQLVVDAA